MTALSCYIQGAKGNIGHLGETGTMGKIGPIGTTGPKGSRGTIGHVVTSYFCYYIAFSFSCRSNSLSINLAQENCLILLLPVSQGAPGRMGLQGDPGISGYEVRARNEYKYHHMTLFFFPRHRLINSFLRVESCLKAFSFSTGSQGTSRSNRIPRTKG